MNNAAVLLVFSFLLLQAPAAAQDSTKPVSPFSWLFVMDAYYSYDLNKPPRHQKPSFLYHYDLHNRPAINLALLKGAYRGNRIRAQAGWMTGTYPEANLASEPAFFRNIFEANAGLKLAKKKDYWLEAGIFSSHIGFESAIASDNATLTRSLAADNTPYYETGIKISYKPASQKWFFAALLLNGWQRVKRAPGNTGHCWGTQISFTPAANLLFNWSSFQGNDKPDSIRQFRSFHNFYAINSLTEKWKLVAGFDIGFQRRLQQTGYDSWFSLVCILQYASGKAWSLAGRLEYYHDPHHVVIPAIYSQPFKTAGFSVNADLKITRYCSWRTEYRLLKSRYSVFERNGKQVKDDHSFTTSIIVNLGSRM